VSVVKVFGNIECSTEFVQGLIARGHVLPDALKSASKKRQADYLVGRRCARQCLLLLGQTTEDLAYAGHAKPPSWPARVAGSISHTRGLAVSIATTESMLVGIDIERVLSDREAATIQHFVVNDDEWHHCPSDLSTSAFTTLVFSAKETIYKALGGLYGARLEFHSVSLLAVGGHTLTFVANHAIGRSLPAGCSITLEYHRVDDLIETQLLLNKSNLNESIHSVVCTQFLV